MRSAASTLLVLTLALWAAPAALAEGASYRVEVAGLACPFCAYGIEKKLHALDGVERVDTHIKEGVVVVTLSEGATLDEATVRQAVQEAGFTLDGFGPVSEGDIQ